MKYIKAFFVMTLMTLLPTTIWAADTNSTVSSTVVTDKAPPTANAPSVVVNNSDVCKSAFSAGVQTQILGIASGVTVTDENCERMKLSRSLYLMGMKVAVPCLRCVRMQECLMRCGWREHHVHILVLSVMMQKKVGKRTQMTFRHPH